MSAREGPCAGLRVVDFSSVVTGPVCAQGLGDLGADVLKIEPPHGDSLRFSGGPYRGDISGMFAQVNRNKRSLVLDLKKPRGQDIARRLAARADVLIENFRPGVTQRIGIEWERLRQENPRLVYVSINGFGSDGPYADRPAYDHVVQGLGGFMHQQGGSQGDPRMVMMSFADKITGQTALQAVLAGLLARERGACQGQRIEVPMLDAFAAFVHPETMAPRSFPPETASQVNIEDVYRCWKTADGFAVGMAVTDPQYQALCRAVGRDDLVDDERYAKAPERAKRYAEYVATLSAEIEKLTTADFVARAQAEGAPFAPINDFDEFRADPQVLHNQIVVEMQAQEGPFLTLRPPARYEQTPASLRRPPPHLGEQTREVLLELGLDDEAIAALREGGVLG